MSNSVILTTQHLAIGYRSTQRQENCLHQELALTLRSGEVTTLLGMNGTGKSTLLRTLGGMMPRLQGSILLGEQDIAEYSPKELAQRMAMVLTQKTSAGALQVNEVVAMGRYPYTGFWGSLSARDKEVTEAAIETVGIGDKRTRRIAELSDGERQKVMIAKALAQESAVILLDEPTAYLDVLSRMDTMLLLRKLAHETGKSILLSTHDMEQALTLSDAIWLMGKELPLVAGSVKEVAKEDVMRIYFPHKQIRFEANTMRFIAE